MRSILVLGLIAVVVGVVGCEDILMVTPPPIEIVQDTTIVNPVVIRDTVFVPVVVTDTLWRDRIRFVTDTLVIEVCDGEERDG